MKGTVAKCRRLRDKNRSVAVDFIARAASTGVSFSFSLLPLRPIPMPRIAIVGAGLSGRLLAFNLVRRGTRVVSVTLIDPGDDRSMGPAYPDDAADLLLNVPAGRMSALADDPAHFLRWAQHRNIPASPWDFLPRSVYKRYVLELLQEAERERTNRPALARVRDEAIDFEATRGQARIHFGSGRIFVADKVVLALGNFPPRHPPASERSALASPRYAQNPWESRILDAVSAEDPVVLIGTGQTMIDLAVSLRTRGHQGRIAAISRRGMLPLPHRGFDSYPSFYRELQGCTKLLAMLKIVRRHLRHAELIGIDQRTVIDSLRPDTQTLWLRLSDEEKRRFVRHVFRHWEIIRSRIPPQTHAVVEAMRSRGRLEVIAGRITDLVAAGSSLEVRYTPRGGTATAVERAGMVINCIGPETDYRRVEHVLVQNLLRRGHIRPGPANLGIDALPNGSVIGRDGDASELLYTIGSPMKGVLWEVLAVPDLRVQAERLAADLLAGRRGIEPVSRPSAGAG